MHTVPVLLPGPTCSYLPHVLCVRPGPWCCLPSHRRPLVDISFPSPTPLVQADLALPPLPCPPRYHCSINLTCSHPSPPLHLPLPASTSGPGAGRRTSGTAGTAPAAARAVSCTWAPSQAPARRPSEYQQPSTTNVIFCMCLKSHSSLPSPAPDRRRSEQRPAGPGQHSTCNGVGFVYRIFISHGPSPLRSRPTWYGPTPPAVHPSLPCLRPAGHPGNHLHLQVPPRSHLNLLICTMSSCHAYSVPSVRL